MINFFVSFRNVKIKNGLPQFPSQLRVSRIRNVKSKNSLPQFPYQIRVSCVRHFSFVITSNRSAKLFPDDCSPNLSVAVVESRT